MVCVGSGWTQAEGSSAAQTASVKKYVPGRVLVRFRSGKSAQVQAAAHERLSARVTRTYGMIPSLQLVEVPETISTEDAVRAYLQNPDVLYAEPDYIYRTFDTVPNDTQFSSQWGLKNTGANSGTVGADIDAAKAWDLSTGSAQVGVVINDTGIDYSHPDLVGNIHQFTADCDSDWYDDDGDGFADNCWGADALDGAGSAEYSHSHGTHVAGIVGATGNNASHIAGVNWRVDLFPCRWMSADGLGGAGGATSDAIKCLDWAVRLKNMGYNIVATNNSWGGGIYSRALYDAIKANMDNGILFIASAGNGDEEGNGFDIDGLPVYPVGYPLPNIVGVAATDNTDAIATFSNFGRRTVHLGAPGVRILSTLPGGGTGNKNGTSMAAPFVAGTAALLKAHNPSYDWKQIKNRILAGGDTVSSMANTITGRRLNAYGAMTCANQTVQARVAPVATTVTAALGEAVRFEYLNINCDGPNGPVSLTVNPGEQTITLKDEGSNGDAIANDGIYSIDWTASTVGSFTIAFPGNEVVNIYVLRPYSYRETSYDPRTITGTSLNLGDDTSAAIDSPFPISFGGQPFNKVYVSSNGALSFDRGISVHSVGMPTSFAGTIVAPLWTDIMPQPNSSKNVFWAVTGSAPNRELVVEWRSVPYFAEPVDLNSTVTFQAVLFENSSDILFNYEDPFFQDWLNQDPGIIGVQTSAKIATVYSAYGMKLRKNMALLWKAEPNFALTVPTAQAWTIAGQEAKITGTLESQGGWNLPVTISCAGENAPSVCEPVTVVPSQKGTPFTLTVSDSRISQLNFTIQAVGSDAAATTFSVAAQLTVVDFSLDPPSPNTVSVVHGETTDLINYTARSYGELGKAVNIYVMGLPQGAWAYPPSLYLGTNETKTTSFRIYTHTSTPVGTYPLTVRASIAGIAGERTQPLTLVVKPAFQISVSSDLNGGRPTDVKTAPLQVTADTEYAGTVTLSCSVYRFDPAAISPECRVEPAEVNSFPATPNIVATGGQAGASYRLDITATDGSLTRTASLSYALDDYTVRFSNDLIASTGASTVLNLTYLPIGRFGSYGVVRSTCDVSGIAQDATCSVQESVRLTNWTTVPLTVNIPASVASGTYPIVVRTQDEKGEFSHTVTGELIVAAYTISAGAAAERTVAIGFESEPFDVAITATPLNGSVVFMCDNSHPTHSYCSYSTNQVSLASGSGSAVVKVQTLAGTALGDYKFGLRSDIRIASVIGAARQFPNLFTLRIRDWAIKAASNAVVVKPPETVQVTIAPDDWTGITGQVYLTCPNAPNEIACSFNPERISAGQSSVLTISALQHRSPVSLVVRAIAVPNTYYSGLFRETTVNVTVGEGDFTLSASATTGTVRAGATAQYTVSAAGNPSFSAPLTLSCSGLPMGAGCSFSPATVTPGTGTATSTLSISTTARATASVYDASRVLFAFAFVLPGLVVLPLGWRRKKMGVLLMAAAAVMLVIAATSCGGGGGGSYTPPPASGTPAGTYNVTVTAASGAAQRTTTVTLVVQ